MKKLAYGFSVVYHPLLMTTLLMGVILWWPPVALGQFPEPTRWILLGLIALLTFVLPLVNIVLLRLTHNISGFDMKDRRERVLPLLLTTVYYGFTTYLFAYQLRVDQGLVAILAGIFSTLLLVTVLTVFYKVSIHAAGAWGGVGIFLATIYKTGSAELLWPLVLSILLAGMVSSARLQLDAHKPAEILGGALAGFLACFSSIYLLL